MKLLDVSRCHEDSPDFRSGLTQLEVRPIACGLVGFLSAIVNFHPDIWLHAICVCTVHVNSPAPGCHHAVGEAVEAYLQHL